jgi:hypothetical protein
VSTEEGKFLEETSSKPCKWVMWSGDVQTCGCSVGKDAKMLPVGAFVEGELYLSWMHFFSKPILAFYSSFFYFFYLLLLFVQELIRGHCPGVVTSGDNVTHKYFHRNEKAGS